MFLTGLSWVVEKFFPFVCDTRAKLFPGWILWGAFPPPHARGALVWAVAGALAPFLGTFVGEISPHSEEFYAISFLRLAFRPLHRPWRNLRSSSGSCGNVWNRRL